MDHHGGGPARARLGRVPAFAASLLIGCVEAPGRAPESPALGSRHGPECLYADVSGPSVVVIDASTRERMCDATVVGMVGGESVKFDPMDWSGGFQFKGVPQGCFYTAWADRPGTYAITASHRGYESATLEHAVVGWDGCHVKAPTFELTVHPEAPEPLFLEHLTSTPTPRAAD